MFIKEQQPKSSFLSTEKDMNIIVGKMIKNERLKKKVKNERLKGS